MASISYSDNISKAEADREMMEGMQELPFAFTESSISNFLFEIQEVVSSK